MEKPPRKGTEAAVFCNHRADFPTIAIILKLFRCSLRYVVIQKTPSPIYHHYAYKNENVS